MNMRGILVSCFICLSTFTVTAQVTVSTTTDKPASKEDVQRLFQVMQINHQMKLVMDSMMKQQKALIRENMKKRYPQITKERIEEFDQMMQEGMKDFSVDEMIDSIIPVYQRHFTKEDIDAMCAFYSTPAGQKFLTEMPDMTAESMQAASGIVQRQVDKITRRAERLVIEENQKGRTPAKGGTQSTSPGPQN